jgi:3-isopropylmalate/(R)-2-methylmalate dehydratase small subunit
MSEPLRVLRSRIVVLDADDVDTDQIIPARFLVATDRAGMGEKLFADWRYDSLGAPRPDFALTRPEAAGAEILVVGRNFGCGSSREHAAWALRDHGFRAIVARSFADIFRGNALKNGIVPVALEADAHARLSASPGATVTVDIEALRVSRADGFGVRFALDPFARFSLLNGVDELGFLLQSAAAIDRFEKQRTQAGLEV